jgi:nitroreductase/NAD-dependent dihydropyrimidine dehydrogenase PreA subunit
MNLQADILEIPTHSINFSLCTNCQLCVTICPSGILAENGRKTVYFQDDKVEICIKCGHCMAMCEPGAISIEGLDYETNFRPLPEMKLDYEGFMDFLITRRSVRLFKDKEVPQELLHMIVDALATAPFGVNPDNVEITVVNDKKLIAEAVPYISKMYMQLAKILSMPVIGKLMLKMVPKESANTIVNFILPHIKKGLYVNPAAVDDITRNAPALILFHARRGAEEHTVDAHIYMTYALLAAHSLGLGATAIGLIGPGINQSKPLRKLFQIPEGNQVVESVIVGYPKFPFKRAIIRPRTKVSWLNVTIS